MGLSQADLFPLFRLKSIVIEGQSSCFKRSIAYKFFAKVIPLTHQSHNFYAQR